MIARAAVLASLSLFGGLVAGVVSGYRPHPGGGRMMQPPPPPHLTTTSLDSSSSESSNVVDTTIMSAITSTTKQESGCNIENFRAVAGLGNVFRCASTDALADPLSSEQQQQQTTCLVGPDALVFDQAGLIIDLRSSSERDEAKAQYWMKKASMQVIESDEIYPPSPNASASSRNHRNRFVMRIDVLSPRKFTKYIDKWFTPAEAAQALLYKVIDGQKLHEVRIECLNRRGLAGLNEVILETGREDLRRGLQAITMHLEAHPNDPVIIHCVQGKDR